MAIDICDIHAKLREDLLFDCVRKSDNSGVELTEKTDPVVKDIVISSALIHFINHIKAKQVKNLPMAMITFSRSDYIERQSAYFYWVRNIYDIHFFVALDKMKIGYEAEKHIIKIRNQVKWSIQGWKPQRNTEPMFIYSEAKEVISNEFIVFTMSIAHEDLESYKDTRQEIQDCEVTDWRMDIDVNADKKLLVPKEGVFPLSDNGAAE